MGAGCEARVRKTDRRRDLAELHVDADGLASAVEGDSDALRPGELVIAVGSPFGFIGAVSTGVIHSVGELGGFAARPWVVSDVRLAPGNSGGPLANAQGQVVGLNTMIAGGLALAIPSSLVAAFLGQNGQRLRPTSASLSGRSRWPKALGKLDFWFWRSFLNRRPKKLRCCRAICWWGLVVEPSVPRMILEDALHSSPDGRLEIEFRRGAGDQIRKVVAQMAVEAVRAA